MTDAACRKAVRHGASGPAAPWVGASIGAVRAARGSPRRVSRSFQRCAVPMIAVDPRGRFVEVNTAARLAVRLPRRELRGRPVGTLASPEFRSHVDRAWADLLAVGYAAGRSRMASSGGGPMDICYVVTADAAPGLYLAAFTPADWPEDELLTEYELAPAGASPLTGRELEVLQLVADGASARVVAEQLVVSPATARTHLAHIYRKLDVGDRAAAVAKGMRLGLII
jgi:DNA-binding CsgD family transcriptional regulator